jgi:hypothetical protein
MAEAVNHPTLSPCPFCGTTLTFDGPWATHPAADCNLERRHLFPWAVAENVRRWNLRAEVKHD